MTAIFNELSRYISGLTFTLTQIISLGLRTILVSVRGPYRYREIIGHMYTIGVQSLSIIAVSTAFAGFVVTAELAFQMDHALHTVEMLPGFSGQFIFRELGIVIPALLLVSKVGAATTAEIGTMKITEQIDALRLLHLDPVEFLVYPRFVATIVVSLCLTLIAIFVTLLCGTLMAMFRYHFTLLEYVNAAAQFVSYQDLFSAIIKAMVFGAVVPIVSCFYGFTCESGAEGVGTATTNSVVTSTVLVIILDFVLTFAFSIILY